MFSLVSLIGSFKFDAIETLQHNIITIVYSFSSSQILRPRPDPTQIQFPPEKRRNKSRQTTLMKKQEHREFNYSLNLFQSYLSNGPVQIEPLVAMKEAENGKFN